MFEDCPMNSLMDSKSIISCNWGIENSSISSWSIKHCLLLLNDLLDCEESIGYAVTQSLVGTNSEV